MMVDSTVLVHAVNRASTAQQPAMRFLKGLMDSGKPWHVSWPIQYEFLKVVTDGGVFYEPLRMDEAVEFLQSLRQSSTLQVLGETARHAEILEEFLKSFPEAKGNDFKILHTATLMKEHNVLEVATGSGDYKRFPGIKIVHPLTK